jgi:hypothetical protein
MGAFVSGMTDSSASLGMRVFATVVVIAMMSRLIQYFVIRQWLSRTRDVREGGVECLYGRVLHLPQNKILVGDRALDNLSKKEQEAFEHNAYYRVYIAPHSGDVLSAERAGKPKYD